LLVVIAIIAVLASMLLPVISKAKGKAQAIFCLGNQKQLVLAVHLYTPENGDWMPPIQARYQSFEVTWRPYLFSYVGKTARVFDCPVERKEAYASGIPSRGKTPNLWLVGQFQAGEIEIPSGISAVNVHWLPGGAAPPFGRPAGYENNLCKSTAIESPSRLLLFGDGHSDIYGVWPTDRWWIWKEMGDANTPGFNRLAQGDKGAVRHNRKSNYGLADGSSSLFDPGRIPCNTNACSWSIKADPH
jgi:prepilin-type processing-associated H-X9-DG protein